MAVLGGVSRWVSETWSRRLYFRKPAQQHRDDSSSPDLEFKREAMQACGTGIVGSRLSDGRELVNAVLRLRPQCFGCALMLE